MSLVFTAMMSLASAETLPSPAPLSYDGNITIKSLATGWSLYGCRTEQIEITGLDPVTLKPRFINVIFYKATDDMSQNAVVILPPTGGVNVLDRGYANELCRAGISVALIEGWQHQLETSLDLNMHNFGALRFQAATRQVLDFLESRKMKSIGLLGTSIGAIGGALAFGADTRISAATFIVGSSRFADVIAYSDEKGAAELRHLRMKKWGLSSSEEYRDVLRRGIPYEPFYYIQNGEERKTLVISADNDTTVATEYQHELASALGGSGQHLRLKGNHLQVIKEAFFFYRSEVISFFEQNLESTGN